MPWKERSVVEERERFVEQWMRGEKSVGELCREFGVSRKTGYKIWERFRKGGLPALEDWGRRPKSSPHKTRENVERRIVELRGEHSHWGPKKLRVLLLREGIAAPALSTIAAILKRNGLAEGLPRRRRGVPSSNLIVPAAPNDLWCIDFKGWFRTTNGTRCDPLTVMDSWSRYLVACHGLFETTRTEPVLKVFERLFEEYGMPRAILSDNGSPWASTGAGGLTKLSAWWIRLGILPLRIHPGRPQENGRLERLHRTLKRETATPPAPTPRAQQERFDRWREEYNFERPHEVLGQRPPAEFYGKSGREYRGTPPTFDYPGDWGVRKVYKGGQICWHDRLYQVTSALVGEDIGVCADAEQTKATLYLGDYVIGLLDLKSGKLSPPPRQIRLLGAGVPPPPTDLKSDPESTSKTTLQPPHLDPLTRLSVLPMSLE